MQALSVNILVVSEPLDSLLEDVLMDWCGPRYLSVLFILDPIPFSLVSALLGHSFYYSLLGLGQCPSLVLMMPRSDVVIGCALMSTGDVRYLKRVWEAN